LLTAPTGKSDTSGMPPESEITSGRDAAEKRSRTALVRILRTRPATREVEVSNCKWAELGICLPPKI
jgi:hypothetical protein